MDLVLVMAKVGIKKERSSEVNETYLRVSLSLLTLQDYENINNKLGLLLELGLGFVDVWAWFADNLGGWVVICFVCIWFGFIV